MNTELEKRFQTIVIEICRELDIHVIHMECNIDHVYLFLNAPPNLSPADIMAKVKGVSSKKLRAEFDSIQHLASLWTRTYLVSTAEEISKEIIHNFIENQKKRG